MDKSKLRTFAIESRRRLIEDTKYQASLLGITDHEINEPVSSAKGMETYQISSSTNHTIYDDEIEQRKNLVREIKLKGFDQVIEEVAYTWFNRIIAIRYMEVNDYLPTRTRVLSSETPGKIEPDIITEALDLDLDYDDGDIDKILELKESNKLDDLFKFLFIKQCNKLNDILPNLFEKTSDFTELLLNISFNNSEGIIQDIINNIPEEYFTEQVEIIGWMYQFYNTELKDDTFKNIKKNKVSKERIPAATQLFTPDWIVKYMVENSIGRLWLNRHPNETLKSDWKYYIDDAKQDENVYKEIELINDRNINLEEIKILDPCMGSGHILVYAFDVLMKIYLSQGYSEKDAAISILKNNIYGLDIDDRAYQLAYFALMMKARQYNRRILTKNLTPNVVALQDAIIDENVLNFISYNDENIKKDLSYLIDTFNDAKEFGSLIRSKRLDFIKINEFIDSVLQNKKDSLEYYSYSSQISLIKKVLLQADLLSQEYDVVITNPPYMANRSMKKEFSDFLKKNYADSKSDLFATFIERCQEMLKPNGYSAMITMQSFMFLSTFENLRMKFLEDNLINMVHLGSGAFEEIGGEVVQTTAFVRRNSKVKDFKSTFVRLVDTKDKEKNLFNKDLTYETSINNFNQIPGSPIAYWADKHVFEAFQKGISLDKLSDFTGSQNITANNSKYLRFFWEINSINSNKWVPYAKGGNFRKYFGNIDLVVDWSDEAKNFYKNNPTSNLLDKQYWFKEGITYTAVSSKGTGFRYLPKGCIFDKGGPSLVDVSYLEYCIGFLNCKFSEYFLNLLNPTLNIQVRDVKNLPIIYDSEKENEIGIYVRENIEICKNDWEDYETSWEFKSHPFIRFKHSTIEDSFNSWKEHKSTDFNKLKSNEIELNKIFSEIYSIDVDPNVEDKYVSVTKADYENDVKSFISYAVGCMLGRYSLDKEGISFAGGEFNLNNYSKFIPDDDNVIPILDTAYFEDDIVGRFIEFVKVVYGEESLEENLDFIAGALKNRGNTSREVIRNYFLNDFFSNHVQTYKKCPIYWQFDSGKQNGFKCLVYMHRYEPSLVARVRTDYLHKTQKKIEENVANCDNIIENSTNSSEVSKATKLKNKLIKQLTEIKTYDEALAHIANKNIEIDLDDGVKENYAEFQSVELHIEGQKNKKINLLKKY